MNNAVNFTIINSSNGKSFKMEAPKNGSIEIVKNKVNDIFLIENKSQIILYGNKDEKYRSFNNSNTVEILDNKILFVYNKSCINNKLNSLSTIFEQEELSPIKNNIVLHQKTRNNIENNAVKYALINYEMHFHKILKETENIIEYISKSIASVDIIINENENQLESVRAVITNLTIYNDEYNFIFNIFNEKIQNFDICNDTLNKNFDQDILKLITIELHDKIKDETYKKLIDYISVEQIKEKFIESNKHYKIFKNKIENLNINSVKLNENIKKIIEICDYFDILNKLNNTKNCLQKIRDDFDYYVSFKDNLNNKIKIIEKSLDNGTDILKTCHEMDDFFQNYNIVFENQTDILIRNIENIYTCLNELKKECFYIVNKTVNDVSFYQNEIVNIKKILKSLDNVSTRIHNNLYEISIVSMMPIAYKESLFEIYRRLKFGKEYNDKISSVIECIAKIREEEVERRKEFMNKYIYYLPKKYIDLCEMPSQFDINFKKFDENLPEIGENFELVSELIIDIISQIHDGEECSVIYSENEGDGDDYLLYFQNKFENENVLLEKKELENENFEY